jgi:hypothetical protein
MKTGFNLLGPKAITRYAGRKASGIMMTAFMLMLVAFGAMVVSGDIIVRAIGSLVGIVGIVAFMLSVNYIQARITKAELGSSSDSSDEDDESEEE